MLDWRYTPLQILENERALPHMMEDLAIMNWQKRLIKEEQMGDSGEDKG